MAYDSPVAIPQPENVLPKLDTRSFLLLGGLWGEVRSGQTWLATDGARLVWSADSLLVVYSIKGQFFSQTSRGFRGEVATYPLVEGARRAAPMGKKAYSGMPSARPGSKRSGSKRSGSGNQRGSRWMT